METKQSNLFPRTTRRNDGFTLVELIVVIAILAILSAVAIPAYSGYIEKANRVGDDQLLSAVNTAFASACMENGEYDMKNLSFEPKAREIQKGVKMNKFNESFQQYFAGNGVFRYYGSLRFNAEKGLFEGVALADLIEALADAWKDSSLVDSNGDITKTLLKAFDGIGGWFTSAVADDMNLEEWLLNNVSDELADALGLNGMLAGFTDAQNISDAELEEILSKRSDYDTLTEEQKADLKDQIKGNMGVLHFANDAAGRDATEVKESVDNFIAALSAKDTVVDYDALEEYYLSICSEEDRAEYERWANKPARQESILDSFRDQAEIINLGDLKLTGGQAAAVAQAAQGSNSAGITTLGSMYALAAGYYNSDFYKNSDDYDPNYTPAFAEFGSFLDAIEKDSFKTYYEKQGENDLEAYLSFMSYLSANPDVDVTSNGAFTDQFDYIWNAIGG